MNAELLSTGILLIVATLAFAIGASAPDYSRLNRRVWSVPEEETGADPRAWRWANYAFLVSAFLTLVGLDVSCLRIGWYNRHCDRTTTMAWN